MLRKKQIYYYTTLQVSQRSTNFCVRESKNNWIVTIRLKHDLCTTTSTTTNSEPYRNEVKAAVSNKLKSLVYLSSSLSLVKLCVESDSIKILSWSQVNVNTSCACVLVSRIVYDVEMTISWKGSNCLNAENACFDHGIWTWILTGSGPQS